MAFRRRTVFAAPLIVIVGCGGNSTPQSLDRPSWSVRRVGVSCRADLRIDCPPNVACNPPAPREIVCPRGTTETLTVTVVEKSKDRCAIVPRGCTGISCATEATPCPTSYEAGIATPPPKLAAIWSIRVGRTPGSCDAYDELACNVPAGQPAPPCNPPPPIAVGCPKGFVRDTPMRIGKRIDGSCAIAPAPCADTSCVKDAIACPGPPTPIDSTWRVKRDPTGECVAVVEIGCPHGPPIGSCNPPPPQGNRLPPPTVLPIPCPPTLGDKAELLFARFANMKCAIIDEDCRDASCAKEPAPCLR